LSLAIAFAGDATGQLRLVGTPRYQPAAGIVDVPDLDFDLDTDSKLVQGFAWLRSRRASRDDPGAGAGAGATCAEQGSRAAAERPQSQVG
jgi:hypothetical protein